MKNIEAYGLRAAEIFKTGVCCSESIVHTFAEDVDPENAMKYTRMSSGLCGGMGCAAVCGVVTGGACAIGLYFGRDNIEEAQAVKCSTISKLFVKAFQDEFRETGCKELKTAVPADYQGNTRAFCAHIVQWGAEKVAEIVIQQKKQTI
ncbi:MAG: C-GCAxxG-C-C family protein [Deferribacteraceae bacterium]|jgi:C_GCAxxG_C_C family probable redox protein|nr:C-GCAxxG-C-C family protein [Deferribacteraceae bacterium]